MELTRDHESKKIKLAQEKYLNSTKERSSSEAMATSISSASLTILT
jgi:hypothetical protein